MAEPKLINERTLVEGVAAAWERQYGRRLDEPLGSGRTPRAVLARLRALDVATATAADVAAIIGNHGWVAMPRCHCCGLQREAVVRMGEEPDYDSATIHACAECLRAALALLTTAAVSPDPAQEALGLE